VLNAREGEEWLKTFGVYFGITLFSGALVKQPGTVLALAPVVYIAYNTAVFIQERVSR
jgi:hypothetical protein